MALRTWNDTVRMRDALAAVGKVAAPNTQLQASGGDVLIDNKIPLRDNTVNLPCLLIQEDQTIALRRQPRSWKKTALITLTYLDEAMQNPDDFDAQWRAIDDDMQRIAANLEDDSTLSSGNPLGNNKPTIESITRITFSPYAEQDIDDTSYARTLVKRTLFIEVALPNYTSAR